MVTTGRVLSRGVRRAFAWGGVLLYLLIYANAGRLLPAAVFRDAQKIQEQMHGAETYAGSSFDVVGKLFLTLGPAVDVFVMGTGVWLIWTMFSRSDRIGMAAAALMLAAPCLFFNLFMASKDTLVVLMALVIAATVRGNRPARAWMMTLAMYLAYAATLRAYFALIAGLALAIHLLSRLGWRWRVLIIATVPLALAWVPPAVFVALQQPRDLAVDYLVFQSPYGARTSFYNPFSPTSLAGFAGNYIYAVFRLNVSILWSPGIKEMVMQLWTFLAVVPPVRYLAQGKGASMAGRCLPACLVTAHVAVSMLFEPDLGSYMRHLSSVAPLSMLLLMPERTSLVGRAGA